MKKPVISITSSHKHVRFKELHTPIFVPDYPKPKLKMEKSKQKQHIKKDYKNSPQKRQITPYKNPQTKNGLPSQKTSVIVKDDKKQTGSQKDNQDEKYEHESKTSIGSQDGQGENQN